AHRHALSGAPADARRPRANVSPRDRAGGGRPVDLCRRAVPLAPERAPEALPDRRRRLPASVLPREHASGSASRAVRAAIGSAVASALRAGAATAPARHRLLRRRPVRVLCPPALDGAALRANTPRLFRAQRRVGFLAEPP